MFAVKQTKMSSHQNCVNPWGLERKKKKNMESGEKNMGCVSVLYFFILVFIVPHCFNKAFSYENNMNERNVVVVKMSDNEKEIEVRSGDIIQIELEALGSAGYWWHFDDLKLEEFDLLSERTKPLVEGKIGAPVLIIWQIKAKKEGKYEIRMYCFRHWEGKKKSIGLFSIKLSVKELGD